MKPAVVFEKIGKFYRTDWLPPRGIQAVRDVSLQIPTGSVFGLLGPNRAGKTTLVKLLLTLIRPTTGQVIRLGEPGTNRRTLRQVGYMHENQSFPKYLSASQLLRFYGGLTLLKPEHIGPRADALLERVGLADRKHDPIASFSKGMVQRLALAQALLNEPALLVLDEPAEGLDLFGRKLLREVIAERKKAGGTVLVVSHATHEVEQTCDEIAVIVGGKLAKHIALNDLLRDPKSEQSRSLDAALQTIYESAKS